MELKSEHWIAIMPMILSEAGALLILRAALKLQPWWHRWKEQTIFSGMLLIISKFIFLLSSIRKPNMTSVHVIKSFAGSCWRALLCSKNFAETLQRVGVRAESILYEGKTHTDVFLQARDSYNGSVLVYWFGQYCTCWLGISASDLFANT